MASERARCGASSAADASFIPSLYELGTESDLLAGAGWLVLWRRCLELLYHEFKQYGPGHIESRAMEWRLDMNPGSVQMMDFQPVPPTLDDDPDETPREFAQQVIRRVWTIYGSWTAPPK